MRLVLFTGLCFEYRLEFFQFLLEVDCLARWSYFFRCLTLSDCLRDLLIVTGDLVFDRVGGCLGMLGE